MQSPNPTKPVEVVIGGKVYRLTGNDSEEYIQSVARYLNKKLVEISKHTTAGVEFTENYPIILALNIADDLFKERQKDKDEKTDYDAEALSELSDMSNELVERTREIDALKKEISDKDNAIAKYSAAMQKGSIQFENFKKAIAERDEDISKLRNKLAAANSDITSLTTKNDDLNQKLSEIKIEVVELNQKISDKNKELNNLSVKLSEKNTALNELNKKSAERNQRLNSVNKERDELAVKLKAANNSIAGLNKQIEKLESTGNAEANTTIASLRAENERLVKENADAVAKLEKSGEDYTALKESMPTGSAVDLQNALNAVKAENRRLSHDNEQLMQELSQAKNELKSFIDSLK